MQSKALRAGNVSVPINGHLVRNRGDAAAVTSPTTTGSGRGLARCSKGQAYLFTPRFNALPAPSLVEMKGNWIGDLPFADQRWERGNRPRMHTCILDPGTG
jgi:hypothetical protein